MSCGATPGACPDATRLCTAERPAWPSRRHTSPPRRQPRGNCPDCSCMNRCGIAESAVRRGKSGFMSEISPRLLWMRLQWNHQAGAESGSTLSIPYPLSRLRCTLCWKLEARGSPGVELGLARINGRFQK
eukprot:365896-Chlamydomonas_euryale.AAC.8